MQRYVDILTDAGFKAVFGDQRNKDVLIDLLNVMLPPHRKVKDITYQTTEIPSFSLFNKSTRLDLRCKGGGRDTVHSRSPVLSSGSFLPQVRALCFEGVRCWERERRRREV